jgi:hypothetical protein
MINGEDLRPWYIEREGRYLLLIPDGWTKEIFGSGLSEEKAWKQFQNKYPAIAGHLAPFEEAGRKRTDKGEYWWELRPCSYYSDFEGYKLIWPEMGKLPRFALVDPGIIGNKTTFMIPGHHPSLLGILMSRVIWFAVSQICTPLRLRAGLWQYNLFKQFTSRLPIPDAPAAEREAIGSLAMQITEVARTRYKLHERARRRILSDLGGGGGKLNQKLTRWWELDFATFRAEVKKALKHDIPLKERDEWDEWLEAQREKHQQHTAQIVQWETDLNGRVYALFDLSPAEIAIIEESTKYQYGEV